MNRNKDAVWRAVAAFIPLVLAVALFLLTGCAKNYPQRFTYEGLGFNIITAPWDSVDRHCRKYVKRYDGGAKVLEGDGKRIRCCYRPGRYGRRGFIIASEDDIDCIVHELCHASGMPKKECAKIHYKSDG